MISVIIPAFNEGKYITACVESVKNQNFDETYEIIVVNNASTDNTAEIARSLGVKVITEGVKGLARAKNRGMQESQGDLLVFVDADCIIPQDHLQKIKKLFSLDLELAAIGGPYYHFDSGVLKTFLFKNLHYMYFYFKALYLFTKITLLPGGNTAIKKSVLEKIGGFKSEITDILTPEDLEISKRLSEAGYKTKTIKNLVIQTSARNNQLFPVLIKTIQGLKILSKRNDS